MGSVIITLKILPSDPEIDLEEIYEKVLQVLEKHQVNTDPSMIRKEIEPIAFGISALIVKFIYPEEKGLPDVIEEDVKSIEGVDEASFIDIRRAL
ncbi:MAG: elongation factor 1-beta [Candidatus Woesearchaeota archaeon]